jgi:archaellum component FlaC
MDITVLNKKVNNTPDNIKEELEPISDEYIKEQFDSQGDASNPLDYYTKAEVDSKVNGINSEIGLVKTNVTAVDTKIGTAKEEVATLITQANEKITTLEEKAKDITKITYATIEPTNEMGNDGDLWVIYEE